MAKRKRAVNKSQSIRDVLKKDPKATPKGIKAALARRGIEVSDALISFVKYRAPGLKRASKAKQRRGRPGKTRTTRGANGQLSAEHLLWAKEFASRLGSVRKAKEALEILEKLQ